MKNNDEYIGDGVYARWDGYQVRLVTNDPNHPNNIIFLDEYVMMALFEFYNRETKNE